MSESPESTKTEVDDAAIVSAALEMAAESGWYDLSLVALAQRSGLTVNALRSCFPDSNAIADAWFAAALRAMLTPVPDGFDDWPARARLEFVLWRWFGALAPHHAVTVEMLKTKLHLPHVHHWVAMPFDLSRMVQLWRDASGLRVGGFRRQIEEVALTGIFLATLADWCRDDSVGQQWTRGRFGRRLDRAVWGAGRWFGTD